MGITSQTALPYTLFRCWTA